ncbi:MAG: glutaredoxin family protein [Chloroflexi bacterium]|nr:glutaredoxin family protein [Chloroflexota bacterium]
MTQPIIIFGATDCDDTERTREHLTRLGVPFREVNIDHNADAERFVIFINGGFRSTPTVVVGEGKRRLIVVEPTDDEIDAMVKEAGYR